MLDHRSIILRNGPGPSVIMTIDPPFAEGRRHVFANVMSAWTYAAELSEITDWPIVDQTDSARKPS